MNTFRIKIDDTDYLFVCNSRNTRHGFAHDCDLFITINDIQYNEATAHCYYYNRTWERWTYQTVCLEAINNLIENHIARKKYHYLMEHGYKRMTKDRVIEFNNLLDTDPDLNSYKQVKEKLNNNTYY